MTRRRGISFKMGTIITTLSTITIVITITGRKRRLWKYLAVLITTITTTNMACSLTITIALTTTETILPQALHQHPSLTITIITPTIYTPTTTIHYPSQTISLNAHMKSKNPTFNCLSIISKRCHYLSGITHKVDSFKIFCHRPLVNRLILLFKRCIWSYQS